MQETGRKLSVVALARSLVLGATLVFSTAAAAQMPPIDQLLDGVVQIKTFIDPDGRTVPNLGRERAGSGIVIDDSGLVLTIGYLMVEAHSAEILLNDGRTVRAEVAGYDHDTGFGLLRAATPLKVRPFVFGKSADLKEKEPVLAASFGGMKGVAPAFVVGRREFAGNWEYLVDSAIFTAPAHSDWSGAALINREGKLVGVGSLIIGDVSGKGENVPGNMYVPIDLLQPILADLISSGRALGAQRPWLGLTTDDVRGRLFVGRVAPDGPAEKAGLKRGDIVVGVNGEPAKNLGDFYRKIWASGAAGAVIPLDVLQDSGLKRVEVKSANRHDHLKLKSTF